MRGLERLSILVLVLVLEGLRIGDQWAEFTDNGYCLSMGLEDSLMGMLLKSWRVGLSLESIFLSSKSIVLDRHSGRAIVRCFSTSSEY